MARTVSIISEKGGVGKSTTAINLAGGLIHLGKSVCIIDINPQQNVAQFFEFEDDGKPTFSQVMQLYASEIPLVDDNIVESSIRHSEVGIDYAPSSRKTLLKIPVLSDGDKFIIRNALKNEVFSKYDYIILDCKDSLEEYLTPEALSASDDVIIVTECGQYSFFGLFPVYTAIDKIRKDCNPNLKLAGVLINKKLAIGSTSNDLANLITEHFGNDVFNAQIPFRFEQIEKSLSVHKPCVQIKGNTLRDVYLDLAKEYIERSK